MILKDLTIQNWLYRVAIRIPMIYQESQINNLSNFQIVVVPLSVVGGVGGPANLQAQPVVVLYICHAICSCVVYLSRNM